jgi:hypothetical protein
MVGSMHARPTTAALDSWPDAAAYAAHLAAVNMHMQKFIFLLMMLSTCRRLM